MAFPMIRAPLLLVHKGTNLVLWFLTVPTAYTGGEMDSCPVCYVTFSTTQAEDVARKLPCEHVACTQCLEDCFEEATERGDKTSPPVSFTAVCCWSFGQ